MLRQTGTSLFVPIYNVVIDNRSGWSKWGTFVGKAYY